MINEIFTWLNTLLTGNIWIAIIGSFSWGILSVLLSPCHLSGIPLIIGFINSRGQITLKRTFTLSLVFASGILTTIAVIGLITALLGRLMGDVGEYGNYLVASVFFIMGLYLLDIINLPWDSSGIRSTKSKGLLAALALGLLFGIGLGPCTFAFMAPVLGVVFSTAVTSLSFALLLLLMFGLGHCSVIATAGTLTKKLQLYLNWTEKSKAAVYVKRICGVLVIFGGIYMIYTTF
ncbi:MAG: cytochrome C biogenesis protein [Ignavibacteriae bacterium]|nr:MAG: cytochrome C biogenesis protein [Ignavibacteriota bacterium]